MEWKLCSRFVPSRDNKQVTCINELATLKDALAIFDNLAWPGSTGVVLRNGSLEGTIHKDHFGLTKFAEAPQITAVVMPRQVPTRTSQQRPTD